jgi:hypothetical protein
MNWSDSTSKLTVLKQLTEVLVDNQEDSVSHSDALWELMKIEIELNNRKVVKDKQKD